jgi:hypothetical protein
MAIEKLKLTTMPKNKPGPFHELKTIKRAVTTYTIQKSRTHICKFLTPLALSVRKILHGSCKFINQEI